MANEYAKIDEAILGLTGSEEWTTALMPLLEAENQAALQNELDAKTWEDVKFQRGYRAGLLFVANIREVTKVLIEQANA